MYRPERSMRSGSLSLPTNRILTVRILPYLKGKNREYDAILPYAGKETIHRILEIGKNPSDDTLFASVHTPGM